MKTNNSKANWIGRCGHWMRSTVPSALRRQGVLWLVSGGILLLADEASANNYEAAVASKLTEIQWAKQDLLAAERELAFLDQFLLGYDNNSSQIQMARQQLQSANSQLLNIQQNNLVKLTIRMGIETYNTISDTVSVGKTAASALVTHGVSSAAGAVAFDRLQGALGAEGQQALGMDSATLSSPRTVKIHALSESARNTFPELDRVQRTLGLSLEAVQSAAYQQDGTELGTTGAILRKNIMVREEIDAALGKLEALATEANQTRDDAEGDRPSAQASVNALRSQIATLEAQLEDLMTAWRAEQIQQLAAENPIHEAPPVPKPTVNLTIDEGESQADFDRRVAAAVREAALAQWDNHATPVISQITALQQQIQMNNAAVQENSQSHESMRSFVNNYRSAAGASASDRASYSQAMSNLNYVATTLDVSATVTDTVEQSRLLLESMVPDYAELGTLQNRLRALANMLQASGAPVPATYAPAMISPGMGITSAMTLAAELDRHLSQLPTAQSNAGTMMDQLSAAAGAWSEGVPIVAADVNHHLHAAEQALADMVQKANQWNNLLATRPGMALNRVQGMDFARLGFFTDHQGNFSPVLQHIFNMPLYRQSLLAAIQQPGAVGASQAIALKEDYTTLCAAVDDIKDAYDAAVRKFFENYYELRRYGYNLPVLSDWNHAAIYNRPGHQVDTSGITNQNQRLQALTDTVLMSKVTNLQGGPWTSGATPLVWRGLTRMHQLIDPGLDDPEGFLPHRLALVKQAVAQQGQGWLPLPPELFTASYNAVLNEVFEINSLATQIQADDVANASLAVFRDLGEIYQAYLAANPAPTIATQPAGSVHTVEPGQSVQAPVSVTASGNYLSYQWFVSRWTTPEFGWEPVPDSNTATLITPALSETRWFKVQVSNISGSVESAAAEVRVQSINPPPVFTSAASATARVGRAFRFHFKTESWSWIMFSNPEDLPPGLEIGYDFSGGTGGTGGTYMTLMLHGTPTQGGVYLLRLVASGDDAFAYQTFRLTVSGGSAEPAIVVTDQPKPQLVATGGVIQLALAAESKQARSYLWRRNRRVIAETSEPLLQIPNVSLSHAGRYDCVIRSAGATFTSAGAQISVVSTQPSEFASQAGKSARLSAPVAGVVNYAWLRQGEDTVLGTGSRFSTGPLVEGRHVFVCRVTCPASGHQLNSGAMIVRVFNAAPEIMLVEGQAIRPSVVSEAYSLQVPLRGQSLNPTTWKLQGEPQAETMATRFSAKGLPRGLRIDNQGVISGRAQVGREDPYPVEITARNNWGQDRKTVMLSVQSLMNKVQGVFSGPIARQQGINDNLGGEFHLKTASSGALSGHLILGGGRRAFRGQLDADHAAQSQPRAVLEVRRGRKDSALELSFIIDGTGEAVINGTVAEPHAQGLTAGFEAWSNPWLGQAPRSQPAAALAGVYHLGLFLPARLTDPVGAAIPQGHGFLTLRVNAGNGSVRTLGRLADHTAVKGSSFVGPEGQVLIYSTLYHAKALGSVLGVLHLNPEELFDDHLSLKGTAKGELSWLRPADLRSRSYPQGFWVDTLVTEGTRYHPPLAGATLLAPAHTGAVAAQLLFEGARIETAEPLPNQILLFLNENNRAEFDPNNVRRVAGKWSEKLGTFGGRLFLSEPHPLGGRPDPLARTVNYQGLMVRLKNPGTEQWEAPVGVGYFLLPQLPDQNEGSLSGSVLLAPRPPL